ncbi:cytochrome P450 89A2-like [Chenopodium quinoa]|uniref:Cytochrome P450 n=1 Tax=Chenopodium quinoa TaxID=63459 RepID=A0A803L6I1_CHEQI|nr:cytochrome P450 89A2-like [Chenopodium quinoa]
MANLVKYPQVQAKLVEEIKLVIGPERRSNILEEDLDHMPFLKATILEVLRRHPPAHMVIPHRAGSDVEISGYMIPKDAAINVLVADIGRDPNVWEGPMEFNPDRFLVKSDSGQDEKISVSFDVAGRKEIKMMPFGVGRRMCPGNVLARMNLEYMVANLVWHFEWKAMDGEVVDLDEKEVFAIMMKNPLRALISPTST